MAATAGISFSGDLFANVKGMNKKIGRRIDAYMESQAPRVQDYMRENAPWTDRTGAARQGLFAQKDNSETEYTIHVYHTVSYGIWLEISNAGQYRIIQPTITAEGARIMQGLSGIMGSLGLL